MCTILSQSFKAFERIEKLCTSNLVAATLTSNHRPSNIVTPFPTWATSSTKVG